MQKNIKVLNNHFVTISDTRTSAQINLQDKWEWVYRVYALEDLKVKFRGLGFYKSVTRPTEEQCLHEYFQYKRDVLQKKLTEVSSEKLSIDKVLEQLDDFEKVIEINTVLKPVTPPNLAEYELVDFTKEQAVKGARVYYDGDGFGTITNVANNHSTRIDVTFDNTPYRLHKNIDIYCTGCKLCVPKKINTVLKSDSKFSVGDEVYVKFWDEDGVVTSVSNNSLFVQFRNKGTKPFNKKGEWLGEIPAAGTTLQQLKKDTTLCKLVPLPEDVKVGDKVYDWKKGSGIVESTHSQILGYAFVVKYLYNDSKDKHIKYFYSHYNREGNKAYNTVVGASFEATLKLIQY